MALDIPSEPKVYTSVYDNFKGVDFTNDPSNVYRRRSPSGRNLLPDLDGRPLKRKGWKIDVGAEEFLQAFRDGMDECIAFITAKGGLATEAETERMETCQTWKESFDNVTPYKTYYFELGSIDYILVYNNLGVFIYDGDSLQYIWHYVNRDGGDGYFPKYVPTSSSDAKRGFFYEANGTAGFYLFNENVMFRLQLDNVIEDGVPTETLVLHEIKPFVPTAFISCDPATGAGTNYRPINILTRRRIRSYTCISDNTVSRYKVPDGIQPDDYNVYPERLPTVRVIIGTQWVEIKHYARRESPSDKGYRIDSDNWEYIVFCEADGTTPFCPTDGEVSADNVTIEYEARNELQDSVKVLKRGLFTLARNDDGTWGYADSSGSGYSLFGNDGVSLTQYGSISVPVDASGITNTENIRIYYRNQGTPNLWVALGESQNDYFGIDVDPYGSNVTFNSINNAVWNLPYKSDTVYKVNGKRGHRRVFELKFQYNPPAVDYNEVQRAFFSCTKFSVFGTGLVNQVFACGTQVDGYKSRLWYSMTGQPEYFPDTNYTEVGSNDTAIMGTLKCGEYLGVIKQGKTTDTSVYLAYPTSFENTTTFAVKQSISGIGAVSNGAFNVLNEEPLFLSAEGVVGIELANEFRLRSRSHFINGRLTKEPKLSTAISFVFDSMYWLAVGGSCYVLDGTQKSSWANEKTNLQYECYYLDNIPAQCFAKMDNVLYWSDFHGNLCRFKTDTDEHVYTDEYDPVVEIKMPVNSAEAETAVVGKPSTITLLDTSFTYDDGVDVIEYVPSSGERFAVTIEGHLYVIVSDDGDGTFTLVLGSPFEARWSTIADDDGMVHFFKNMKKKGCLVSLLPESDSGVEVWLRADEKDPVKIGETDVKGKTLPFEFYVKKKVKKYKRLQIICKNSGADDGFGIDQIIKSYTVGNYSKNRG